MDGRQGRGRASRPGGGKGREHGPQAWLLETENWKRRRGVRGRLCEFSSAKEGTVSGFVGRGLESERMGALVFFFRRKKLGGDYRASLPGLCENTGCATGHGVLATTCDQKEDGEGMVKWGEERARA